jgi:hypothetical protein
MDGGTEVSARRAPAEELNKPKSQKKNIRYD